MASDHREGEVLMVGYSICMCACMHTYTHMVLMVLTLIEHDEVLQTWLIVFHRT